MPSDTELHKIAYKGDAQRFAEAFEQLGLPIDCQGANGRTPLHRAVSAKNLPVVKVIVEKFKGNVNSEDNAGMTPLHWAALVDDGDSAAFFFTQNCDVNHQNKKGETALHLAAQNGSVNVVNVLQSQDNIDLAKKNAEGLTAYDLAKNMYKKNKQVNANLKQSIKLLKKGQSGGSWLSSFLFCKA